MDLKDLTPITDTVDVPIVQWNITYNKEQPKFSVSKAKEIYSEVFWIRDQIEEAVSNSLDFTKA